MSKMAATQQEIQAAYEAYTSGLEQWDGQGSRAIAIGRTAGLALDLGKENVAQALWKEIPSLAGMPSLAEFRKGYEANPQAFVDFGNIMHFPAGGTAFSNAAGSYAFALDNAAKANTPAGEDSVEYWAGEWGAKALTAAGFPQQATQLKQATHAGKALAAAPVKGSPGK